MKKLIALALFAFAACDDPFDPGSLITDTRVLGARVEVAEDAERASPGEGETAQVTLLMAAPGALPELSWALLACLDEACETPLARAVGHDVSPTLELTVPAREQLGDAEFLRVVGIVCSRGEPDERGACVGAGAKGTALTFQLPLAGQSPNLNPDLTGTSLSYAGKQLTEGEGACTGLPMKADGKEHDLKIELGEQARELYLSSDGKELREELQISHFVDAGELARQFSFVAADDPTQRPQIELSWQMPSADYVKNGDRPVRLLTVVRDLRGGTSLIESSLCLTQ